MLPLLVLVVTGQPTVSLATLAYDRAAFESKVVRSDTFGGYDKIFSMPEAQASFAYYPAGVSSRRYMIADQGSGNGFLIFQEMQGGRATTKWYLKLLPGKSRKPRSGTLRLLLWHDDMHIQTKSLTKSQRMALDAKTNFAAYGQEPIAETLWASFVNKDGTGSMADEYNPSPKDLKSSPFLPIVEEEAALLGFAKKRWYGPGKFDIRRHKTND